MDEKSPADDVSASTVHSDTQQGHILAIESEMSRKDQLRVDLNVVPILGMIYLIIFLDRSNIANARIEGLVEGLNMPANGYNTAIWIFYLSFVCVQVPSNLILSLPRIRPNLFLGTAIFCLGIVSMCQGLTKSYGGLLVCRFLMGVFEGSLPASTTFIVASYYTKQELSKRFAWFYVFSECGPCFSGLLAYAIENMNGTAGYEGWRWIFILEGLLTIAFSFCAYYWVPAFPEKATFLSEGQRAALLLKLNSQKKAQSQSLKDVKVKSILLDYRIWLLTVLFFCCDFTASSISSFLPTILTQLGWATAKAQVMTIPVWVCGMVFQVAVATIADRTGYKLAWNAGALLVCLSGWIIQRVYPAAAGVRYFGLYLMAAGCWPQFALLGGHLAGNLRGRAYLAIGMAIQAGFGQSANFVSSNVFITAEEPTYHVGFTTGLVITSIGAITSFATWFIFIKHNENVERKLRAGEISEDDPVDFKLTI